MNGLLFNDVNYTQIEMSRELAALGNTISQSQICKILKKMIFTRKVLVKVPEERNSAKVINARQEYAGWINRIPHANLVILDETTLRLHQVRNFGYSPKNVKACKTIKANRGTNISCLVAINKNGIVAYIIRDGPYNSESFMEFI